MENELSEQENEDFKKEFLLVREKVKENLLPRILENNLEKLLNNKISIKEFKLDILSKQLIDAQTKFTQLEFFGRCHFSSLSIEQIKALSSERMGYYDKSNKLYKKITRLQESIAKTKLKLEKVKQSNQPPQPASAENPPQSEPIEQTAIEAILKKANSEKAKKAADAKHNKPGGSRDKANQIRAIWATGKYSTRDICAEEEYQALGYKSFGAVRRALNNTPAPKI